MNLEEVIKFRKATEEQLSYASAIATEILEAQNSQPTPELGLHGTVGYMSSIGSPHQWWEKHCKSYRIASEKFQRDRDLHTVCLLADEMLKNSWAHLTESKTND